MSASARSSNLFGQSRAALRATLAELGEKSFRAGQVYGWLYARRVHAIEAMTDLPQALRRNLSARFTIAWPEIGERLVSYDGTIKYLLRLLDGTTIESVYIPEGTRRTICVSTQAGCPLNCAFCLTGVGGFQRHLTVAEIVGQVARVMADTTPTRLRRAGERPWNVVFMGMGEPLLNLEPTLESLRILLDPEGFAIPPRKLTLSTVGIVPALERLAAEPVRPNLAISLHAAEPRLRRRLMPIEAKYSLESVIEVAERYRAPRGGAVTYEYVLLRGVNDGVGHARKLARLLRNRRAKVNLIPLNPAPEIPFETPGAAAVDAFCGALVDGGVTVSVRRPRGHDVSAACGQLKIDSRRAPTWRGPRPLTSATA